MNDSTQPHYADGQPIRNGDAVLVEGVHGARVEMSIPGLRPAVVLAIGRGKRRQKLEQGRDTERLVLVERDSGDFGRATFDWLSLHAAAGEARAQFGLGEAYRGAVGTQLDVDRGIEWIAKAAAQGDADAQSALGFMHSWGSNLERDAVKAVHWYRLAAEQGEPYAQFGLASHYEQGFGVATDYVEAVRWYRAAAEQGHAGGMCNLADKYERGLGVEQDFTRAAELYRKSADKGISLAMECLARLYKDGRGVQRSAEEAERWAREAVRRGASPEGLLDVLPPGFLAELTESHRAALSDHYALWVQRAQRTMPIESGKIVPAIVALYHAAKLATPRVVIVPSPIVMAVAGCFAAYILEKEKTDPGIRSQVSLPDEADGGHAPDTVRAIALALGATGGANATRDAAVNASEETLNATYQPADVASANAMEPAVIKAIQQSFDIDPLRALDSAVRDELRDPFGNPTPTKRLVKELEAWVRPLAHAIFGSESEANAALATVCNWWQSTRGGNAGAYWEYCLTAARDVVGLKLPEFAAYEAWEACAIHGSFRFMHADFCMVCDFPAEIGGQAAFRWRDGWSV